MYYDQEIEDSFKQREKSDWYAAQGAYWTYLLYHEVKYMLAKNRPKPQLVLEDFLMEFGDRAKVKREKEETEGERLLRAERSKASWMFAVGMIGGGRGT